MLGHDTLCRWGLGASGLLHGEGGRVPGGLLLGGSRVLGGFEEVEEAHFVIDRLALASIGESRDEEVCREDELRRDRREFSERDGMA